ncbi:ASCH domain-containing protein [Actinomadura sediminis]|uniref:ASCH domain-containing protein n=1 Tax=Actinomadura sediminis TaxID=1038904 RepID=A0ABW3EK89_9ACTN
MLFKREVLEGIVDGRIDRVFRVWAKPPVRAGSTQRTWAGIVVIDSVTAVTPEEITGEDALRSGFADRAALLAALSKSTKVGGYHRVMLHLGGPGPEAELAGKADLTERELGEIEAALDAIDTRSRRAPWTREVLRLIEEHPGLRAVDLAERMGREKLPFKADVRRLKALGLTESLETGYRLSPRGEALMAYLRP